MKKTTTIIVLVVSILLVGLYTVTSTYSVIIEVIEKDGITEIVNKLKEIGYSGVCRAAGESKKLDNSKVDIADVNNELEIAIQAKCTKNLPNYYTIRENCPDSRDLVLIWKKVAEENSISKGTLALVPIDLFYEMLKVYHNRK